MSGYDGFHEQRRATISPHRYELSTKRGRTGELLDPETWDWNNTVIGVPAPDPTLTLGVRLDADEARTLGDAAHAAKMPLSRYIKRVALEAAERSKNVVSSRDAARGAA